MNNISLIKQLTNSKAIIAGLIIVLIGLGFVFLPQLYFSTTQNPYLIDVSNKLGTALFISGLISLFNSVFLKRSLLAETREELKQTLSQHFGITQRLNDSGLSNIYEIFPLENVLHSISISKKKITIIQTWTSVDIRIEESFFKAIKQSPDCQVTIVLLNPESCYAKNRSCESGYENLSIVPLKIKNNLSEFSEFCIEKNIEDKVDIYLNSGTPTIATICCDDTIFFAPYLRSKRISISPWFELRSKQSILKDRIDNHMKLVINESEKYTMQK